MGVLACCVCKRTDSVLTLGKNGWVDQVHMVYRSFLSSFSKEKPHDIRHQNTHDSRDNRCET